MVNRNALSGEFYLIFILTAELFPTIMRGTAFGICNLVGRLSAMALLILPTFEDVASASIVLGLIMLLAAGLAITLEETVGKETEEMIQQSKDPILMRLIN